jgi:hypothetical protein
MELSRLSDAALPEVVAARERRRAQDDPNTAARLGEWPKLLTHTHHSTAVVAGLQQRT